MQGPGYQPDALSSLIIILMYVCMYVLEGILRENFSFNDILVFANPLALKASIRSNDANAEHWGIS